MTSEDRKEISKNWKLIKDAMEIAVKKLSKGTLSSQVLKEAVSVTGHSSNLLISILHTLTEEQERRKANESSK